MTYNNTEFDPLQGSDIQFGKFKANASFEGQIRDSAISFFPLSTEEIVELYSRGKAELKQSEQLSTSKGLLSKSQEYYLRETYARQKKVPQDLVQELEIDPELLRTGQEDPPQENVKVEELDGKAQLKRLFAEHPDIKAKCNILC